MSTPGSTPPSDTGTGLVLLGREGCHLCEQARVVVLEVAGRYGAAVREIDVDTDPELRAEWGDLVPALLVDGVCLSYYRIDADRLAGVLARR